jgi:hypothetical protein
MTRRSKLNEYLNGVGGRGVWGGVLTVISAAIKMWFQAVVLLTVMSFQLQ